MKRFNRDERAVQCGLVAIYRSLLPSQVLDELNRGPFVLAHAYLDRNSLLFDDNLQLSGVINWEFSMIEPILLVGTSPPWAYGIVMNNAPAEPWLLLHATYVNSKEI